MIKERRPITNIKTKNVNDSLNLEFELNDSRNKDLNETPSAPNSASYHSKKNGSIIAMGR